MPPTGTYRVTLGASTRELTWQDDTLHLDGQPADVTTTRLADGRYQLVVDGQSFEVVVAPDGRPGRYTATVNGRSMALAVQDEQDLLLERFGLDDAAGAALREVHAPMPGLVLAIEVAEGDEIEEGQGLLVLEAMKMENELRAQAAGRVRKVHVAAGDAVAKGALLIELE